jgi:hypothetical protein
MEIRNLGDLRAFHLKEYVTKPHVKTVKSCNHNHIIKNVCYDNGCHLDSHVKNKHYNYKEETKKIKNFLSIVFTSEIIIKIAKNIV